MRGAAALLLGVLAGCAATEQARPAGPPAAEDLGWLAGHWVMATPDGRVEELWLPPAGGTLYGVGRTCSGDATRFFEFLAIEPRDGERGPTLAYVARPRGGEPTEFLLTELSAQRVIFANPQHDRPKRIIYERRGDEKHVELHARVDDGTDTGEGEDYVYRRAD